MSPIQYLSGHRGFRRAMLVVNALGMLLCVLAFVAFAERGAWLHGEFDHAITALQGEALTQVEIWELHLLLEVLDDGGCDIDAGRGLDAFQTRRRIDLEHLRTFRALEHVDASSV